MGVLCPNRGLWYRSWWPIKKYKSKELSLNDKDNNGNASREKINDSMLEI